ncbi:MAG: endopeptidase La [Treponema sp.]|nr:endopeptidase La [Treponema sp.]
MAKDENTKDSEALLPARLELPSKLFILPLGGLPIFPGIFTPFMVSNNEDIKVIEEAYKTDGYIGFVLLKEDKKNPGAADLYSVGTAARIIKKINLPDGGLNLFVSTISRFKIKKVISESNPMVCAVEYLEETGTNTFEVKALTRALISEMREISETNAIISEEMRMNLSTVEQPGKIADFITSILNIDKTEQQKILETLDVRKRMEKVLVFIKKEQEILRVQKKIQTEINDRVEKSQREYFLREELKSIQEELGIAGDGKSSDYKKFSEKIASFKFEGEIKETLVEELAKFQLLDPHESEYNSLRNFLELVCSLPWNDTPMEKFTLQEAKKTLEKDHYGLEDVKKRIIEYLGVRKLKDDTKGAVLILVGPPGVGKTSVGRSIAQSMKRPFYRFSVGGEHDESKIKGFRRTYIGSMPGQIIQGLKITKSRSPVFMIDEVDKMNASAQGDPSAALLEVLDPEQNSSFRDTYLDLPFDLSSVLFILTANTLDTIPRPLLDRAEIIELNGYIDQEKIEIAKKYLIPKTLSKNGLKKNQVKFSRDALVSIATEYAREAGVRNFEKLLDKIIRKIVLEVQEKDGGKTSDVKSLFENKTFSVEQKDIKKYLGIPYFDESSIKKASVPGTAIGLAWTSMGGDTLLLEAVSFESSKAGLVLTGQMGDVMKESAQIAFNWVKQEAIKQGIKESKWFEENTVHLHIPEGATPKDGPSAGITMATAFMSLLKGKIIKPHLAMTGELSLTGQVLPIGGLREKTVAAKRNGIKTILIPKANEKDLEEIPEIVKKGIRFIPVTDVREVLKTVF